MTERIEIEYTVRHKRVPESWCPEGVVTDNLHWTTDLKKAKKRMRDEIAGAQSTLEHYANMEQPSESVRSMVENAKLLIESIHVIYREVSYSEPVKLEEE